MCFIFDENKMNTTVKKRLKINLQNGKKYCIFLHLTAKVQEKDCLIIFSIFEK